MIANEKQSSITKAQLKKFEMALAELETQSTSAMDANDLLKHQLYLDAIESQINSFKAEIAEYDRLQSDRVDN
jgi:HTH-type transcriptional regulator / antitoxin HipB